jgi:hypothetical protein
MKNEKSQLSPDTVMQFQKQTKTKRKKFETGEAQTIFLLGQFEFESGHRYRALQRPKE